MLFPIVSPVKSRTKVVGGIKRVLNEDVQILCATIKCQGCGQPTDEVIDGTAVCLNCSFKWEVACPTCHAPISRCMC